MVTKASLIVEYNGETCAVILDGMDLDLLVNSISCLNGKGKLQLVRLNDSFKLESLKELVNVKKA